MVVQSDVGQQDSQAVQPAPAHALTARDVALLVVPREEAGALPGEGGVVQGASKLLRECPTQGTCWSL
jgi:hypothetical protein